MVIFSSWARCECVLKRIRFNFLGRLERPASERAIHRWHGVFFFSSSRSFLVMAEHMKNGYTHELAVLYWIWASIYFNQRFCWPIFVFPTPSAEIVVVFDVTVILCPRGNPYSLKLIRKPDKCHSSIT